MNPLNKMFRTKAFWIAVGVILLVAVIIKLVLGSSADAEGNNAQPTFDAKRGPLTISFSEPGTVNATEMEIISSEVEGSATIIYLIKEGTPVKEGDLLVELDASSLQDGLVEQQIRVQNANAAFISARENLAVTKNQAESDISLAELNYRFAQEDLKQYEEGLYKQELMKADSKITLAEEELQLATEKLEWSEKLYKESYISQSERDADRLSFNRAKLDLELAKSDKILLENFTYTREVDQRKSDVAQSQKALERAKLKAAADIVQADAELKAKEAELKQQKAKEEKNKVQLSKTKIRAPREGLAIYATSGKVRFHSRTEPLEEGQQIRERQELINLPTADEMKAVIQVHESNLDMVRLGLPVVIKIDALQNQTFIGKVTKIAPLPDAMSAFMNPDLKVYRTEIQIDGKHPELRNGMSCRAEVIVDQYDDIIYVPVQSVVRVDGIPTVYLKKGHTFQPVQVEVGLDNNRMIHILSGLQEGQTVMLTPPLREAAATRNEGKAGGGGENSAKVNSYLEESKKNPAAKPATNAPGADSSTKAPAPDMQRGGKPTPEQREAMRKRFESMTPEQREAMKKKMGRGRPGGGAGKGPQGSAP